MYRVFPWCAAGIFFAALSGCQHSSESVSFEEHLFDYTADGDQLVITPVDNITPSSRCGDGGNLELFFLKVSDTVDYIVEESTLKFVDASYSQGIYLINGWNYFFEDTNLVVQQQRTYERDGGGEGLEGRWEFAGFDYFYSEGEPTAQDDSVLSDDLDLLNEIYELVDLEFNGGAMREIPDRETLLEDAVQSLESDLLSLFTGILAVNRDGLEIQATGVKTSEVVTLTLATEPDKEWVVPVNRDIQVNWKSSNGKRAEHTFYDNPVDCPNSFVPDWWDAFMEENSPGTATAVSPKGRRPFLAFERTYPELVRRRMAPM